MKTRWLLFPVLFLMIGILPSLARAQPQTIASQDIKPPQLLSPGNGSTVKGNPEFFWTSAVVPRGFKGSYKLKVVPVSPGQPADAALAGNSPVHQATMRRTGESYPAGGAALKNGQTYAWCVQVVDAAGSPVGENQGMSEVFVFTYEESEAPPAAQGLTVTTQPLVMTGMRVGSLTIDTLPLVMTGMRAASIAITTQPLVMTGIRATSIVINTESLVMTGTRVQSISINTQPLVMTGMRVHSVAITTDPLKMTGMREEQTEPPVESDKAPSRPSLPEELRKKLDLPLKKPETPAGINQAMEPPGGAQMKPEGAGKTVGDTATNTLRGRIPPATPPTIPGNADDGAEKSSTLLQQRGAQKSSDDGSGENETAPVRSTSRTVVPAGTGSDQRGQKLPDIKESASQKKSGSQ